MTATLLGLQGVHTHIGAYHILHGVDLDVPAGEVPSFDGTGKIVRCEDGGHHGQHG